MVGCNISTIEVKLFKTRLQLFHSLEWQAKGSTLPLEKKILELW